MRRIPELDSLRGIAAIVIVVFHMRFLNRFPIMASAIDLFFVLSGYLITTIILDQRRSPGFLKTFYIRRSLRIWPIYYLALFACLALNPLLPRPEPLGGFWYYATYLQNTPEYGSGVTPAFSRLFSHSWTLAIEEQFYLLWPLFVVLVGRKGIRPAVLTLLVLPIVLRATGFHPHMLLTCSDGLALGALLADLFADRVEVEARRSGLRRTFWTIGLIAVVARQVGGPLLSRFDGAIPGPWTRLAFALATAELHWIYFSAVGLVLLDRGGPRLAWLRHPRLVHLGTISYGVYLYHPFVLIFFPILHKAAGLKGSPWMDIVKVGVCVAVAEVSWRLVERPILSLKDQFPYMKRETIRGPHFDVTSAEVQPIGSPADPRR